MSTNPADTTSFCLLNSIAVPAAAARQSGVTAAASSKKALHRRKGLRAERRHRLGVLRRQPRDLLGVARIARCRLASSNSAVVTVPDLLAERRGDRQAVARRRAGRGGRVAREPQVGAIAAVQRHEVSSALLIDSARRSAPSPVPVQIICFPDSDRRRGPGPWPTAYEASASGVEHVHAREPRDRAAVTHGIALSRLALSVVERAAEHVGRLPPSMSHDFQNSGVFD